MTSFISRADATAKLRRHILETYSREQLYAAHEPSWGRLRNYEFEQKLEEHFGGSWCINEWCPFDGIYCAWQSHAPDEVIEEMVRRFERDAGQLRARGRNPEMLIAYLRDRKPSPTGSTGQ